MDQICVVDVSTTQGNFLHPAPSVRGLLTSQEAGRSSEVERSLMVRSVVRSILHGVDPLSYFSIQRVLHDWCNKVRGMCYPVCGMVHIKEPLLLIDKSIGQRVSFLTTRMVLNHMSDRITVDKMY